MSLRELLDEMSNYNSSVNTWIEIVKQASLKRRRSMKGDVWYLKDMTDHNRIIAKFEFTDDFFTGHCWRATSWNINDAQDVCEWDYIADVYLKWDACTHWRFYGEDYGPGDGKIDHYYHLCGTHCFFDHIRCMCFVWRLAIMIFSYGEPDVPNSIVSAEYYQDYKKLLELIDLTLNGCIIEKEEN